MSKIKLITTKDGSHTLFLPEMDETYHSNHGATQEAEHVFVTMGLSFWKNNTNRNNCKVLEIGFGTGLNALVSYHWGIHNKVKISYDSLETFPLSSEWTDQLNYCQNTYADYSSIFNAIHRAPWNTPWTIADNFILHKLNVGLETIALEQSYDLVFFDAFAPNKQPEMWTLPMLSKVINALNKNGIFVTYCAKGQLKRDLKALGCEVQTLPGPPGKKEMVRAVKL